MSTFQVKSSKGTTARIVARNKSVYRVTATHRGAPGVPGTNGVGMPTGGLAGQVLVKNSNSNFDFAYVNSSVITAGFIPLVPSPVVGNLTALDALGRIADAGISVAGLLANSFATQKLVGRTTVGTGVAEEIAIGNGLTMASQVLSVDNAPVNAAMVDNSALMTTLLASIPSTLGTGTSQKYRAPTDTEATGVIKGLKMIAQEAGKAYSDISLTNATAQLSPYGFTLSLGYDSISKRPYALAQAEATYPSSSNYRAWGNYFFDLSRPISLLIEAPHPQTDGNSEYIALRNWQNVPGALYVMSSVNRKAKDYMTNEIYTTGATGGTFTLTFRSQTTSVLAYNATPAQIQTALEALTSIGTGKVIVTGDNADTTLHAFANLDPSLYSSGTPTDTITGSGALLTGTSPTLTIDNDADQAHNYNSLFNKAISAFALQGYAQLQLHGFSDVSSGIPRIFGVIQSRASSNDTKLGETVRSALEANGFDVARKGSFATQGLYVTGAPTGGSIVLTYNGVATAAITYSATLATFAANVQAALEAHTNIGTGNVAVTQSQNDNTGVSQALVITFKGALYHQGLTAITVTTNSLTGGTSPNASGLTADGTALTAASNTQGDIAELNGTVFMHLELSNTIRASTPLSARLVAALSNVNLPQLSAAAMPVLAESGHTNSQSPLQNGSGATIGTSPIAARADHRHAATNNTPSEADYIRRGASSWTAVSVVQLRTDLAPVGTPSSLTYLRGDGTWATPAGGGGTNATNLSQTLAATTLGINSDTGTDIVVAAADATNAGVMTNAMFTKLNGIAVAATANSSDATLLARANHTGTQLAATVSDFSTAADARIAAAAATGTGSIVRATSPTITSLKVATALDLIDAPITGGSTTDVLGAVVNIMRNAIRVGRIDNNANGLRVQAETGLLQLRGTGNTGISVDASGNAAIAGAATASNLSGTNTGDQVLPTRNVSTVTTTITLLAAALVDYTAFLGAGAAPTLPTAVGNTNKYTIKNIHTTNKTIATTSSQTIDGSTTITIIPNQSVDLISNGTNWQVV